jgi:hypothetical protein
MIVLYLRDPNFKGPLKRVDADAGLPSLQSEDSRGPGKMPMGTVALVTGKDRKKIREAVVALLHRGAAAVLEPASPELTGSWQARGQDLPELPLQLEGGGVAGLAPGNLFALSSEALARLNDIPDGTMCSLEAELTAPEKKYTWNAIGKIPGSDPALRKSALLLSAHLDHLGIGKPVNGDSIYNGADDDASGTVAVLELARVLGAGPRPKRTVVFALFGSEELGGLGSTWFRAHPPVPLADIAVNLEFEMIGRRDPKYPPDSLWLTGWERSNLGPVLAEHGAKLMGDTRPEDQFFERSDNYVLAKQGVVAQTVSSYGEHADYHQPSDDIAHIDFKHMTDAIGSLIVPIEWLVNSNFRPEWSKGGRP